MTESTKTPKCINCKSSQVRYDSAFGFYKCENCSTVWGQDKDDPDYDEEVEKDWRKLHDAYFRRYPN
ncbi:MAG: TFIIB-type zinc ribbon-containing protein [Nostoc sp.]